MRSIRRRRTNRLLLVIGMAALGLLLLAAAGGTAGRMRGHNGVHATAGPIVPHHAPAVQHNGYPWADTVYPTVPDPQGYYCYDIGHLHACYLTYDDIPWSDRLVDQAPYVSQGDRPLDALLLLPEG